MVKRFCDRCGHEIRLTKPFLLFSFNEYYDSPYQSIGEYCENCRKALYAFVEGSQLINEDEVTGNV